VPHTAQTLHDSPGFLQFRKDAYVAVGALVAELCSCEMHLDTGSWSFVAIAGRDEAASAIATENAGNVIVGRGQVS
jgi:hypothetical protein